MARTQRHPGAYMETTMVDTADANEEGHAARPPMRMLMTRLLYSPKAPLRRTSTQRENHHAAN
ncbi:hypothetical protein BCEP4_1540001 [Burkholderia cepacia]|nr:hypothetical protein BCEP4_1540001 [Burkholderia cepacia]